MNKAAYRHGIVAFLLPLMLVSGVVGADGNGSGPVGALPTSATPVQRFDVWEMRVKGNTLLDEILIERTLYPFVGPGKGIDDVEAARQALERFYANAGYPTVVVEIPEQDVSGGIVRLDVVQGRISRVRVSGSRYFSLGRIREATSTLSEGETPNLVAVQKQLTELNQGAPDRSVTPIFRPGRTPGTVEVELRVKDELPLHGELEMNNRAPVDTTDLRASATLRYSNLWQREHSASLMFLAAPENTDDAKVFSGTYVVPLGSGNALAAYVVDSESDVASAGDLSTIGNGSILGARYIRALSGESDYYHSATFGVDYKDFQEDVVPLGDPGFSTPISYTHFSVAYRGSWRADASQGSFGASANSGVRGLGNTEREFEEKRFMARPNYLYLTAFADYTHDLVWGAQAHAALDWQLADSPLVSNEQIGAGGVDTVRGYYESLVLGDDAMIGRVELLGPQWRSDRVDGGSLRLVGFLDAAKLRVRDALPGQTSRYELYGAGLGLQAALDTGFDAVLDWALPLHDVLDVEEGDGRAHFSLKYRF